MSSKLEKLELTLLFEAVYRLYGYDFRNYSIASAKRRVFILLKKLKLESLGQLQHLVIHDVQVADELLLLLSINVTEMFREPEFFKALRKTVLPNLKDLAHIKIWHAGCSSGEEAYSMAILLLEQKLLRKTQLYATDFNAEIIEKAKQGTISLKHMREHIQRYQQSGGVEEFINYYNIKNNTAVFNKDLKSNIMFSHHNLSEDGSFGEMEIIICRNVMIYFDKKLQLKVFKLLFESLASQGYLCLGSHESLLFSGIADEFEVVSEKHKIYRKL